MIEFFIKYPWVLMIILVWTLPWKGAALWKSARRAHLGWFIALLILNTLGILDILYIFLFSKLGSKKDEIKEGDSIEDEFEIKRNYQRKIIV